MKPDLLVDVRTSAEFDADHVAGAINIPHQEILGRIKFVQGLRQTDLIVLYCGTGMRSSVACAALESIGFLNVVNGGSVSSVKRLLDS